MAWSLSSDFSLIHNPSSVWSYGSKPVGHHISGTFSLFTHLDREPSVGDIVAWFGGDSVWYTKWLGVYYNTRPTAINLKEPAGNIIAFTANGVGMHPGNDGRFSVVRFTAPTDGNYALDVTFTHIHNCSSNTGVYIVYNNLIELAGVGDSKSLFKSIDAVKSNESIDFIVGVGLDNIFNCDLILSRVDVRLLENSTKETPTNTSLTSLTNENKTKDPVIAGSIGIILGLVISAILFYVYYRYRKNKQNINTPGAMNSDHEVVG
ncbi:hypothetical protein RhiirA4_469282 [Rhizophagus irregularis]|uniref:Uncharacterized protein n=1 Tax=Rhizophagus irregularis TaxID=588596 RepID=A0A2I1GZ86_9GLOM|nr:hypothetical protein RhiirA4_469282 [Rhizophagus irregularis]